MHDAHGLSMMHMADGPGLLTSYVLRIATIALQCMQATASSRPRTASPDTVNGFKFVRDLYDKSNDTSGVTPLST